ncbi:MAG: heparan-alpha-glucosaminide N-acetyltransferase domain-containing protein [Acinetobacter sp.]
MSAQLSQRLQAIDALRGLVIVIMMLDHVRETFYLHHQVSDPMHIGEVEPALFFSRTLAHLCAPVFVLLTGLSAYLYQQKYSIQATREFLFKRGLFLVILELTIINFAWTGQFPPQVIYLQVIWAIGLSMLVLSLLIALPNKLQWIIAIGVIALHNLLDQLTFQNIPILHEIWNILHQRGWIEFGEVIRLRTSYPILPWIGVILLGYCLGRSCFQQSISIQQRNKKLLKFALLGLVLFFVLRLINIYGDQAWQTFDTPLETLMSFFNLTKYPPSLLFILWNCGLGILILLGLNRIEQHAWVKPLIVFGSVPMFFYILHLYVLKLLYFIAINIWGKTQGEYFGVEQVSSLWIITLLLTFLLYPAVLAFSKFKHQNKHITILKYF